MGLGICLRSCPPIQATPESPPLLRYNRYPTPSLVALRGVCSPLALQTMDARLLATFTAVVSAYLKLMHPV